MAGQERVALPEPGRTAGSPGILVVDDERPIVDLLVRYLTQHGYRCAGAYTPDSARALVEADPSIGVVVSDVRMPGGSGVALAEELVRGRPAAAALEIVLITGAGLDPPPDGAASAAFDILRKPFRPSEVAAAAARALARCEERRRHAAEAQRLAEALARGPASLRAVTPESLGHTLRLIAAGLRGPLLPILATAEAIAAGPPLSEAEIREHARRIREDGLRLLALIEAAAEGSG